MTALPLVQYNLAIKPGPLPRASVRGYFYCITNTPDGLVGKTPVGLRTPKRLIKTPAKHRDTFRLRQLNHSSFGRGRRI